MQDKVFENIPEKVLQRIVHHALADPAIVRNTNSGRRIQILSPGRINNFEGPDYLEIAIMLDGAIIVGDAEFHRNSNEWEQHSHSNDSNYANVILHIVMNHNSQIEHNFEILIMENAEMQTSINALKEKRNEAKGADLLDDLQHFALLRILRKTGEVKKILNQYSLLTTLKIQTQTYLQKYNSGRKRPVYSENDLIDIANSIENSESAKFLIEINSLESALIPDKMLSLLKKQISREGAHLRREIILNCVLPIALAISEEQSRINLFLWYWSTAALNSYGSLKRKFIDIPQNFLWQQQGMLEYLKDYGAKKNLVKESIANYGFGEILNFYQAGKTPYRNE